MTELKLYRLITENDACEELGWESDGNFYIWVSYYWLNILIEELVSIFGDGIFDDGSFNANIRRGSVCINLCECLEGYVDLEEIFPKDEFQH